MAAVQVSALAVLALIALAGCGAGSSSTDTSRAAAAAAAAPSTSSTDAGGRYGHGSNPQDAGSSSGTPSAATASSSGTPSAATASSPAVGLQTTALGTFLVDPAGRTLYQFDADVSGKPTCVGACAVNWPPLSTSTPPVAGSGVDQHLLTQVARPDGSMQVAYNGHPLYSFVGDHASGETHGQGNRAFGADWYVVAPSGTKIDNG